jgi:hypothetical protein
LVGVFVALVALSTPDYGPVAPLVACLAFLYTAGWILICGWVRCWLISRGWDKGLPAVAFGIWAVVVPVIILYLVFVVLDVAATLQK